MKISDIETVQFKQIKDLRSEGWKKVEEHDNTEAWIDFSCVDLLVRNANLQCQNEHGQIVLAKQNSPGVYPC